MLDCRAMADEFEQRIDDARRRLADVRRRPVEARRWPDDARRSPDDARRSPDDARQPDDVRRPADEDAPGAAEAVTDSTGRAGDGAVEAVAARGRLRSITLAPALMRRSDAEVAELLTEAVNQALLRSRAELLAGTGDTPTLAGLEVRVEQLRDEGERAMYEIQTALNRAIQRVGDRTGLSGDTSSQGLDQLLGALSETLRAAQATGGGAEAPADAPTEAQAAGPAGARADVQTGAQAEAQTGARAEAHAAGSVGARAEAHAAGSVGARAEGPAGGRGSDGDGNVTVRVDGGGTVTEVLFGPRAFRLPSVDLAEHVVAAVNAALADAEAAAATQSTMDLAELRRRVTEVREASIRQMTQLTSSLTGIMSSIREP